MTLELSARVGIVFSCDEAYVFLARGLVLSLAEAGFPSGDYDIVVILIDIGCRPESLAWMRDHHVHVITFDPALIPSEVLSVIRPAQLAQVMRPWLPDLLPQIDQLIWFDSDIWLQNGEAIRTMRFALKLEPDAVAIAPGISHYNFTFYGNIEQFLAMQRRWYRIYDAEFADLCSIQMHNSTGVFSMKRTSPLWALWRQEIEYVYPRIAASDPLLLHVAEQIALNVVIFRTKLLIRLDPLLNFHCNSQGALRSVAGIVTNAMVPLREIGVVHLANWRYLRQTYIAERLLYRSGDYLTEAEWTAIQS